LPLVVFHDLDIMHPVSLPDEADAPLVVYPDAVLSFAVAFQRFRMIAGGTIQILYILCGGQHAKFATCSYLSIRRQ